MAVSSALGSGSATTNAAETYDISPGATNWALARDLVKHLVATMLRNDSSQNFTDGVVDMDAADETAFALFAGSLADEPDEAGWVIVTEDGGQPNAPTKDAEAILTLRAKNNPDTGFSGEHKAEAAARAVYNYLHPSYDRTFVTLPSGRVVLVFHNVRRESQGMDDRGRYLVTVSFSMQLRDVDVN